MTKFIYNRTFLHIISQKYFNHPQKHHHVFFLRQLEYWFSKYPDKFYKFIEPCHHKLYKRGDSWSEELSIHRITFNRLFDQVGVRYRSKSAFMKVSDKFQGKLYASYYDRIEKKTYYVRNHTLFQHLAHQQSTPSPRDLTHFISLPTEHFVRSKNEQNARSNNIQFNTSIKTSNSLNSQLISLSESCVESHLIKIWNEWVEGQNRTIILTENRKKKLLKAYASHFSQDITQWETYCKTIASNDFLMGKGKNGWKATLDWAIRLENIQKVKEGSYTGQKEIAESIREERKPFEIERLQGPRSWKAICTFLSESISHNELNAWFKDITVSDLEEEYPKLHCGSTFKADWVRNHFFQDIERAFRKVLPHTRTIEIVG